MSQRTLPARWVPAHQMWKRGDTVADIAATYCVPPKKMTKLLTKLGATYPGTFPERGTMVEKKVIVTRQFAQPTLKERAVRLMKAKPSMAPIRYVRAG